MNKIEERIWDYIDGICSLEEQEAISHLIANDPVYRDKYQELMAFQNDIQLIELDEPSMSFTNKVMEKVAFQTKPLSAKAMIDKRIIYGISVVFGVILMACLAMAFKGIDWSSSASASNLNLDKYASEVTIPADAKSFLIYGFIMFDIVAGLMMMDRYLRKRLI